jgi:hypothetical protein
MARKPRTFTKEPGQAFAKEDAVKFTLSPGVTIRGIVDSIKGTTYSIRGLSRTTEDGNSQPCPPADYYGVPVAELEPDTE